MLAKDLISDVVPSIKTSDTGAKALHWMDIFRIAQLPIVNNQEFLGLISDTDIYDMNEADEPIGNHKLSLANLYVYEDQFIHEVISMVSQHEISVIPVLNRENHYLGLITLMDLLHYFAQLTALSQPGGIILLEINSSDYSLSEISQIVESNNAKILSLYLSTSKDSSKLEVTIKLNVTEISSIVKTFERYDYNIKASLLKEDIANQMYEERYDFLQKYLNT